MFTNPGLDEIRNVDALNALVDLLSATEGLQAIVALRSSAVAEAYTEADAVGGVITFAANIEAVEIWHDQATPQTFTVNGLAIPVAPGGWRSPIAGTPAATVTIPAAVPCTVARLV